jgi:hypothetical protein
MGVAVSENLGELALIVAGERSLVGDIVDPQLGYYRGENV